ncbi:MAG: TetR/AcrR family transcriptional regulator [Candidatus Borkfalkiaceae bacterium]|nr:TetR/AcrR family transcriptional regulator [Christensenellaceae bacterium]
MKQDDTKQKIVNMALKLFSEQGYDSVSVGEIAAAVGIKAPSLYNHYPNKQAIFNAIVESTASLYEKDTDKINIRVHKAEADAPYFYTVNETMLFEKVLQIFEYSLHNETICLFRKMMTIEQFRSPELKALYTKRFVDRLVNYHAEIFKSLISAEIICDENPQALALMYVSPVLTLIGICDREPEKERECIEKLKAHVHLFYKMVHYGKTEI